MILAGTKTLREALIYITRADDEYRKQVGLHPQTNPYLGIHVSVWRRWQRAEIQRALEQAREPGDEG